MSTKYKYDFAVILSVKNANPNGDPLNGNRPRTNYENIGEISDVCLKRKIRNRLLDMKEDILIQSDDKKIDNFTSIKSRIDGSSLKLDDAKEFKKQACKKWFDVRAFGQLLPFKAPSGKKGEGVSIPIRGPVSIHPAFSLEPVSITSTQITKSTNAEDKKKNNSDDNAMSSDRMGMKHRVDFGIYTFCGSINSQLASNETGTGFTDEDAEKLKEALRSMFENDSSSARPDGSMEIINVVWWQHSCPSGDISSAKVHGSLKGNIDPKSGKILDESKLTIPFTKDEGMGELIHKILPGF